MRYFGYENFPLIEVFIATEPCQCHRHELIDDIVHVPLSVAYTLLNILLVYVTEVLSQQLLSL